MLKKELQDLLEGHGRPRGLPEVDVELVEAAADRGLRQAPDEVEVQKFGLQRKAKS